MSQEHGVLTISEQMRPPFCKFKGTVCSCLSKKGDLNMSFINFAVNYSFLKTPPIRPRHHISKIHQCCQAV